MECPYCGCGGQDWVRVEDEWALRCLDCLSRGPTADTRHEAYNKWEDRYVSNLARIERLIGIAIQKISRIEDQGN